MSTPETRPEIRFDVEPSVSNHFAWVRTQLALESTLMAAARTAVSLIGFGFTVAQFFSKLINETPTGLGHMREATPRNLGLALIAAGVVSLIAFTVQYHRARAYLRQGAYAPIAGLEGESMHSSTYLIAFAVILIGVAAFASVFARL